MVMKKLLIFSLAVGFVLTFGITGQMTNNPLVAGVDQASAEIAAGAGAGVMSFSAGTVVAYFIVVGVIYLFDRSVVKSFGG